ncbi:hypothetical protein RO3G_08299 [Rhizopus delemar RA 99-880]|uniref:Reverse transcriptase domain-containing protein n=1 Tax=Rhizopus delemar (strain RA 99-880 / ATCC MYA-4621 / FGSC 9543 / NRRL 43880) TaxID=246409 RepID=I1C564_RHIO9|nr:hypothetical protein RO3G_08299 [Rhizopus delemar RA 99-880]|eukprot:EIE83594.1 hypothetical protein RO3G_08299 [Rhizopus delemar RA 99-880]
MITWNERLKYGRPTSITYHGNSIIDYFISTTELTEPKLVIRDDLSLDSNHKFMTLSFQTNIPGSNLLPPKRLTWHLGKLKDDKKVTTYQQVFTNLTADLIPHPPPLLPDRSSAINYIEDFNSAICQAIYQSLDQVWGKSDQQKDAELQKFWTIELQDTFNLKEYYYRKWRKAQGLNRLKYWLLHQETKALLRRMILQNTLHIQQDCSATSARETCPILLDDILSSIKQLPSKKAPGSDHIRQEMLLPIQDRLSHLLLFLFQLCWSWSYTPEDWRVAQVVPIYKKDDPTEPSNYRPISLTSIFRKILERCLYQFLVDNSPPLDLAQCGFREARGSLDQALCLAEICNILRRHHRVTPVLAFLDIKSAYDTVDRNYIWQKLEHTAPTALLYTTPTTNRRRPLSRPTAPPMNCLLYADDVVLIADKEQMVHLLKKCEDHSHKLGYRWNPKKCVILDPTDQPLKYTLYGDVLAALPSFSYLGIPFRPGGYLNTFGLLSNNINKALAMMNQLSSIGINPKGFSPLLATRFYTQIVRAQLEYGLAINKITSLLAKKLEDAQNICLRRIFGGSSRSSVKVMLHLTKLPTMQERIYILQAQFLLRSLTLPDDTLLTCLLPHIRRSDSHSCWYKLSKSPLWAQCLPQPEQLDKRTLKKIQLQFRQDNLNQALSSRHSILLSQCRPTISLDPILWLPMTKTERNRCVRWRLGWLPGGKLEPCPRHPIQMLTKQHASKILYRSFSTDYQTEYHVHLTPPLHGLFVGRSSVLYFMNLTTYSIIRTNRHRHFNQGKDS